MKNDDANNMICQLKAMMTQDVSAQFGGSIRKAAAAVHAKLLVIVGSKDNTVSPTPALEFAKLVSAPAVELDSDCGHLSFHCESGYDHTRRRSLSREMTSKCAQRPATPSLHKHGRQPDGGEFSRLVSKVFVKLVDHLASEGNCVNLDSG